MPRPFVPRADERGVVEHIRVLVFAEAGDDDAVLARLLARPIARDGRIDRHHHTLQRRNLARLYPARIKHGVGPKSARDVVEHLGVQLLPAEPGAPVAVDHSIEEAGREVRLVFHRAASRHDDIHPRAASARHATPPPVPSRAYCVAADASRRRPVSNFLGWPWAFVGVRCPAIHETNRLSCTRRPIRKHVGEFSRSDIIRGRRAPSPASPGDRTPKLDGKTR